MLTHASHVAAARKARRGRAAAAGAAAVAGALDAPQVAARQPAGAVAVDRSVPSGVLGVGGRHADRVALVHDALARAGATAALRAAADRHRRAGSRRSRGPASPRRSARRSSCAPRGRGRGRCAPCASTPSRARCRASPSPTGRSRRASAASTVLSPHCARAVTTRLPASACSARGSLTVSRRPISRQRERAPSSVPDGSEAPVASAGRASRRPCAGPAAAAASATAHGERERRARARRAGRRRERLMPTPTPGRAEGSGGGRALRPRRAAAGMRSARKSKIASTSRAHEQAVGERAERAEADR